MANTINLRLVINGTNDGAIRALTQVVGKAGEAGSSLERMDNATGGFSKTRQGLESISTQLARIQNVAVSVGAMTVGVNGLGDLAKVSDEYTNINNRLKLAATSQAEFDQAQNDTFATAQRNGQVLSSTAALYSRMVGSMRDLGRSEGDAAKITSAVTASIKIANTGAASSSAAIEQFAQAIGSANLAGDELKSVLENAPRLAQALAEGLGVPIGKLKEMGAAGQLSAEQVIDALLSQREALEAEAAKMDSTIGQAVTRIQNKSMLMFGQQTQGAAVAVAGAIDMVTDNLDALAVVATNVGLGLAVVFGAKSVAAIMGQVAALEARIAAERLAAAASVQSAQALVAEASATAISTGRTEALVAAKLELAAAERAYTVASAGAASRLGAGAVAALGGPIGMVTAAVMLGVTAWQLWGSKAEESTGKAQKGLADLTKELKEYEARTATKSQSEQYQELSNGIAKARDELKGLRAEAANEAVDLGYIGDIDAYVNNSEAVLAKTKEISEAEAQLAQRRKSLEQNLNTEFKRLGDLRVQEANAAQGKIEADAQKAIERQIKDQEKLVDAVRSAWEKTLQDVESKRKEANDRAQKAQDYRNKGQEIVQQMGLDGLSPEARAAAVRKQMQDAEQEGNYASAVARSAALDGNAKKYEQYAAQAEAKLQSALKLAQEVKDKTAVEDISKELGRLADAGAKASESEAKGLEGQAESQANLLNQLQAQLEKLRQDAATLEIKVQADGVQEKIQSIASELAALDGKTVTTTIINEVINKASGADVGPPTPDNLPRRAYGGPLPGSAPHDRADNMMYWGTPGEWVIQRPAVRYYGPEVLAAINAMRLPKFANGGQLGGSMVSRLQIPSVPTSAVAQRSSDSLVPAVFNIPGVGRVPTMVQPDVRDSVASALRLEALKKGGR